MALNLAAAGMTRICQSFHHTSLAVTVRGRGDWAADNAAVGDISDRSDPWPNTG